MSFKLGIVGHEDSLREIIGVVHKNFNDIEIFDVKFNNDKDIENALSGVKKILPVCHGILYTRIDPCKLISSRVEHTVPIRYVGIDASHFILSLFKTKYHHPDVDITNISIDTLDYYTIINAYKSLGIEIGCIKINHVEVDTNTSNFVQKAEEEHTNCFQNNLSSLCVTGITAVYNNLRQNDIPCSLLSPTSETYVYEIKNLIMSHKLKKTTENQTVILSVNIFPKDVFCYFSENQFQEILETNKATEQVALFSQELDGAFIQVSDKKYMIICSSKNIELATNNFADLKLLSSISVDAMFNISLGIGYGESIKVARKNSVLGVAKAINEGGSKAYVVYSQRNIIGPIEPAEAERYSEDAVSKNLVEVAEKSNLSIDTIYKINCIIKQKKTHEFISIELAELMGVTTRTINRIIAKLEASRYVVQKGKRRIGLKGRPSRVITFLF